MWTKLCCASTSWSENQHQILSASPLRTRLRDGGPQFCKVADGRRKRLRGARRVAGNLGRLGQEPAAPSMQLNHKQIWKFKMKTKLSCGGRSCKIYEVSGRWSMLGKASVSCSLVYFIICYTKSLRPRVVSLRRPPSSTRHKRWRGCFTEAAQRFSLQQRRNSPEWRTTFSHRSRLICTT